MLKREERRYNIYELYHYWLRGEPIPVDVFQKTIELGYKPERIIERFAEGETPPFSEEEEIVFSSRLLNQNNK